MPIIGHGIDFVSVARIAAMQDEHGGRFVEKCFTEGERAYALGRARRHEHLAARFAAKEAVMKALGTGWAGGVGWRDIEVVLEDSGRPVVALHGGAAARAAELGISRWSLSLSHADGFAIASAIAE